MPVTEELSRNDPKMMTFTRLTGHKSIHIPSMILILISLKALRQWSTTKKKYTFLLKFSTPRTKQPKRKRLTIKKLLKRRKPLTNMTNNSNLSPRQLNILMLILLPPRRSPPRRKHLPQLLQRKPLSLSIIRLSRRMKSMSLTTTIIQSQASTSTLHITSQLCTMRMMTTRKTTQCIPTRPAFSMMRQTATISSMTLTMSLHSTQITTIRCSSLKKMALMKTHRRVKRRRKRLSLRRKSSIMACLSGARLMRAPTSLGLPVTTKFLPMKLRCT